tara:strand:+ start:647 stop:1570 length:924 start_codon:yes stop_codon:yes gene_type:complete
VSLTSACNYACTYCVPNGKRLQPAKEELEAEDLWAIVELLVSSGGIEKLRFTGGEPLLSPKFDLLFSRAMKLDFLDVSLTTNGQLIPKKAEILLGSGLKRINISLDTLDPQSFKEIARGGDLKTVLEGINLLKENQVEIKINMVPMMGKNESQILPLLDFCLERGIELRFIELMNMGHLRSGNQYLLEFLGMDRILAHIGERYEYSRTNAPYDSTAIRYEIPGKGVFGIIANNSEPFCSSCTRLRVSSNGLLYGCLSNAANFDLKPLLKIPELERPKELEGALNAALRHKQDVSFTGEATVMKFIGG